MQCNGGLQGCAPAGKMIKHSPGWRLTKDQDHASALWEVPQRYLVKCLLNRMKWECVKKVDDPHGTRFVRNDPSHTTDSNPHDQSLVRLRPHLQVINAPESRR